MIDTIIFPYEMPKTMEDLTNEQLAYYISRDGISEEDFNEGFALLWKRAIPTARFMARRYMDEMYWDWDDVDAEGMELLWDIIRKKQFRPPVELDGYARVFCSFYKTAIRRRLDTAYFKRAMKYPMPLSKGYRVRSECGEVIVMDGSAFRENYIQKQREMDHVRKKRYLEKLAKKKEMEAQRKHSSL